MSCEVKIGTCKPKRSENFKKASSIATDKFSSSIKYSSFKANYSEIYELEPVTLKQTYQQFKSQLQEKIKEDLEYKFSEKHLYLKLEELENLKPEASLKENTKSWRPSGDPNEDIRDHRYQVKLRHKNALLRILEKHKTENEELDKKLMKNHDEILNSKKTVFELDHQNHMKLKSLADCLNCEMMEDIQSVIED